MTIDQLSGFAIIICFSVGLMAFIELFIFAKRQIMRFALKSRRGPHHPIGLGAHKSLRKEIDRRLEAVKEIKFEPKLLEHSEKRVQNNQNFSHYWRMKTLDHLSLLETAIMQSCNFNPEYRRPPKQDLRYHLIKLTRKGSPLEGCDTRLIHQFVDAYQHARHESTPEFTEKNFNNYLNLMNKIRNLLKDQKGPPDKKSNPSAQINYYGRQKLRLKNLKLGNVEGHNETSI